MAHGWDMEKHQPHASYSYTVALALAESLSLPDVDLLQETGGMGVITKLSLHVIGVTDEETDYVQAVFGGLCHVRARHPLPAPKPLIRASWCLCRRPVCTSTSPA